jgi:hypothetical protein
MNSLIALGVAIVHFTWSYTGERSLKCPKAGNYLAQNASASHLKFWPTAFHW